MGVAFASTIAGYGQWAVDLFNEPITDRNSKSFLGILQLFAQMMNEDFYKYASREQVKFTMGSVLEFVFGGYNLQGKPEIAKIEWTTVEPRFTPQPIDSPYYITGVPDIGNYLINKVENDLPSMDTVALQRLATLLVTETSTTERSVNDKVQMAVIEKGEKLRFIATDEIEKLKSEVSTIIDKEELLNRLIGK
jgi:hypothetical protein